MPLKPKQASRAAIYCRCSTDEQWQGKDFSTLESQANICKHAVAMKEHEGWSLGQVFEDPGYSGGSLDRPGLQSMLAEIEAGLIQAWLREVTVGELVEADLLSAEMAAELFEERLGSTRLRISASEMGRAHTAKKPRVHKGGSTLPSKLRKTRLYASPVDWAAYVIVGL